MRRGVCPPCGQAQARAHRLVEHLAEGGDVVLAARQAQLGRPLEEPVLAHVQPLGRNGDRVGGGRRRSGAWMVRSPW